MEFEVFMRVTLVLLALAFLFLVYSEPQSRALKLVYGIASAVCLAVLVRYF